MIEINLIPDVKQEYLHAKRVRNTVVSSAIIVGIVALAAVVILAAYSFGAQPLRSAHADSQIDERFKTLSDVPDLGNILTIQGQLAAISDLHSDEKVISSRLLEVLTAINPGSDNEVTYSQVRLDVETGMIHIDAQAKKGYVAAEAFEKTIMATQLSYQQDGETIKEAITDEVIQSDQSFGEDATGAKVLRFSVDFEYNEALFSPLSENVAILRPDRQDATDSHRRVPESLFSNRAADEEGGSE